MSPLQVIQEPKSSVHPRLICWFQVFIPVKQVNYGFRMSEHRLGGLACGIWHYGGYGQDTYFIENYLEQNEAQVYRLLRLSLL